ncbi:hypothetical protein WJX81_002944 [Elliptochloris bilobata]|uniref:Uncharacterized protein n=1 Tax=Elliptochloris bilobata TaxID=381761 RepID=A0AAW1RXK6_9CHLO
MADEQDEVPPPPPSWPPPEKRLRTAGESNKRVNLNGEATEGPGGVNAASEQAGGEDQVAAALAKIAEHISSAKKFRRASPLLRQLLQDGKVLRRHADLLFQALCAAMREPERAVDSTLTKEFQKLFTAASKCAELFSPRQQAQLDVYGVWGVLRGQLLTDDSFVFNRVLTRLKTSVANLGTADEADEAALAAAKAHLEEARAPAPREAAPAAAAPLAGAGVPADPGGAAAPMPEAEAEADPFNLDAIMEPPALKPAPEPAPAAAPSGGGALRTRESGALKREALLDCLDTARGCYGHAWARTSVDLAIEEVWKARDKFCESQQPHVDVLWRFVQEQRARRRQGPSAREARRDVTSFETARAEWARSAVSARGKGVGAEGDHGHEVWLG